jgi:disulfide oxidoreductase YuzD
MHEYIVCMYVYTWLSKHLNRDWTFEQVEYIYIDIGYSLTFEQNLLSY